MTFLSSDPQGIETDIRFDETLSELMKALPTGHHLVEKVRSCFDASRSVIESWMEAAEKVNDLPDFETLATRLKDKLDDWERGIAGWNEVNVVLVELHDAIEVMEEERKVTVQS
jgi:hypothetical protein